MEVSGAKKLDSAFVGAFRLILANAALSSSSSEFVSPHGPSPTASIRFTPRSAPDLARHRTESPEEVVPVGVVEEEAPEEAKAEGLRCCC